MNSVVQSILFSKDKYTISKARKWLKENNYISPKVDVKENHLRFRQKDPEEIEQEGFTRYRTKKLANGIDLIIAYKNKNIKPINTMEGSGIFKIKLKASKITGGRILQDGSLENPTSAEITRKNKVSEKSLKSSNALLNGITQSDITQLRKMLLDDLETSNKVAKTIIRRKKGNAKRVKSEISLVESIPERNIKTRGSPQSKRLAIKRLLKL